MMGRSTTAGIFLAACLIHGWPSHAVAQTANAAPGGVDASAELSRARHVLNRLTFGPRPGQAQRLVRDGIDSWIEQQLHPHSIMDSAAARALVGCNAWTDPVDIAAAGMAGMYSVQDSTTTNGMTMRRVFISASGLRLLPRDSARRVRLFGELYLDNGQFVACRLARVESSEQQLLEVLTDFWHNHFYIAASGLPSRGTLVEWDRAVIRPHALGRFRDLLGAVAHSPAMLAYLDNAVSGAPPDQPTLTEYVRARAPETTQTVRPTGGLNENYARELLELHTMGVDGGYTQRDVIEVARAFTGWTHSNARALRPVAARQLPRFVFDSSRHDAGSKLVLGHTLPQGRGIEDGEAVLDVLARHPATARFIARKLAVRFVSDAPPQALVDRAADVFLRTDGDIREVVRTIVTSEEFNSPAFHGAKVKSPLEFVLSMRRALAAPVDTAAEVIDLLIALGQAPYSREAPDGWPEIGTKWLDTGGLVARLNAAIAVANGDFPSIPVEAWPHWRELLGQPREKQADVIIETLLNGRASAETRTALLTARPDNGTAAKADQAVLRRMLAIALGSPEFQRR
jgi:uncharacterized protein (DUF1800 family)